MGFLYLSFPFIFMGFCRGNNGYDVFDQKKKNNGYDVHCPLCICFAEWTLLVAVDEFICLQTHGVRIGQESTKKAIGFIEVGLLFHILQSFSHFYRSEVL